MVRKIQNTYYIITHTDKAEATINHTREALKVDDFTQEVDFTFRKEITDLPVKKSSLLVFHKIKLEKLEGILTPSMANFCLEIINMCKSMLWFSSIKA